MHFKKNNFRNINFKKKTFAIISIIISLLFTGCNIPFLSEWQDGACTSISNTAYDKSASSTNEIIDYIFCYTELKLHLKELKESFPQTKILMINQL